MPRGASRGTGLKTEELSPAEGIPGRGGRAGGVRGVEVKHLNKKSTPRHILVWSIHPVYHGIAYDEFM